MPQIHHQEAIELPLARVETIHVTTGSQKVASLCLVLKDTPQLSELLENPMPTPTMLIVDVVPTAGASNHADVYFRNLTADEVLIRSRRMLSPQDLKDAIIETLFSPMSGALNQGNLPIGLPPEDSNLPGSAGFPDLGDISELLEDEDFDPLGTGGNTGAKELFDTFIQKLEESSASQVNPNQNLYRVRMSLAEAHLAQMLCVSTNAPAFVLSSESTYSPVGNNTVAVWEDFIALLEFPYPDTPAYFDSTALLIQAVTGQFPLSLTLDEVNTIRGEIASSLARISKGSSKALVESFAIINPLNKTFSRREKGTRLEKIDALNLFRNETIDRLYEMTNPRTLTTLLKGAPETPQDLAEKASLENLLADSGIKEVFQDVLDETYAEQGFRLNALPTTEEVLAFYSTQITLDTLPDDMRDTVENIVRMPLFFEHNWAGGMPDIEITRTNVGEVAVSKLLTVAIRLARLEQIAKVNDDDKFVPVAVAFSALQFPGEPPFWIYDEAVKALVANRPDGDLNILFETLLTAGFPRTINTHDDPAKYMETPFVTILHILGHHFTKKWDKVALLSLIEDANPHIATLVEKMYQKVAEFEEYGDIEDHRGPCPIFQSIYEFLNEHEFFAPLLLAHEVGNAITQAVQHVMKSKHPNLAVTDKDYLRIAQAVALSLFDN